MKTCDSEKLPLLISFLLLGIICLMVPGKILGGSYRNSAHGSLLYGVDRSNIDAKYSEFAKGNCAHCHETHASLEGSEPNPAGGPAPHALFADSFNSASTANPYDVSDNFCFNCHTDSFVPDIINQDYSAAFGGDSSGVGPESIMGAFNQDSYHNLYDIWNFLNNDPTYASWFAKRKNPCSGCHNPHLAKRNWDSAQPGFPLVSAISMPGTSSPLWGENQTMFSAYSSNYEAPFINSSGISREPAGLGDEDGAKTPNYVAFCTACHNPNKTVYSSPLSRTLKKINWESTGVNPDKHGALSRDGTDIFRNPYTDSAAEKNNFVLSCLDCHESHGSENIMLLRRRINGENLEGVLISTDAMGYACKRCHADDLEAEAGTGEANRWEYVHHLAPNAPYVPAGCSICHSNPEGGAAIECGNCHGHGMTDSWAPAGKQTGRVTF